MLHLYYIYLEETRDLIPLTLDQWINGGWGQFYKDNNILP